MSKNSYYRVMFVVSALFNILVAAPELIGQTAQLVSSDANLPQGWQFPIVFLYFVVVFGVGYYLVSRDISRNHGIVILGILGKIGVFFIFLMDYVWGAGILFQAVIGCVDLLFAFLFIEFLYSYNSSKQPESNKGLVTS